MHEPISLTPVRFSEELYSELDPGIVDVVRRLHWYGYVTTDSGDGKAKLDPNHPQHDPDCYRVPHVAIRPSAPKLAKGPTEAREVQKLLDSQFGPGWYVEFTFVPCTDDCVILCSFNPEVSANHAEAERRDLKVFQVTIRREWLPLVAAETEEEALAFARRNKRHMVGSEAKVEAIESYELSRKMLEHIRGSLVWHPSEGELCVGEFLDPPVHHSYAGDGWHFVDEEE